MARSFLEKGWDVVVVSRNAKTLSPARVVAWDGVTLGAWAGQLEDADCVLNLAGRSVNCRYDARNRAEIVGSRVASTRVLGLAIAACARPPRVWLNSSSATIYRHAEDRAMDEASGELGSGFSVDVVRAWESTFFEARTPHTRRVALRTAMVMGPQAGGPLEVFLRLARFGLGGRMGPGTQFVSWLHDVDFCRAVEWLIAHDTIDGVVNVAAPNPLTNAEFMRVLREACGAPFGLPATKWMLEIGAIALRTETELPLKSRRVVPRRMLDAGFEFEFDTWASAAPDLVRRSREVAHARR